MVECLVANENVIGSNPISCSKFSVSRVRFSLPAPYNKTCHAYIVSAPRRVTLQHTPHACDTQHTLGSFLLCPARQIGKVISLKRRSFPCSNQGQGTNASETWKSERFYTPFSPRLGFLRGFDPLRWYHFILAFV